MNCCECLCPIFRTSLRPEGCVEVDNIQPEADTTLPVIISHRKFFFDKTWDVRSTRPGRKVKANHNHKIWTSWNLSTPEEPFVYAFGLPESPNSEQFLFAIADNSDSSSVVLSEPQPATFEAGNSDSRLFQHLATGRSREHKLQHIASKKYVRVNMRNRIVLTFEEESGSATSLHFQSWS